jgi:hypothetical protein
MRDSPEELHPLAKTAAKEMSSKNRNISRPLTRELTRRRPELLVDNKPDPGGRVE